MSCPTGTVLEGLKHPTKFKATQNEDEELYALGFSIIKAEVGRLTDLGWGYDRVGKRDLAGLSYKGANIYLYLFYFALFIRRYMKAEGTLDDPCVPTKAATKYKLDCVEKNLPCLSKTYNANYVSAWKSLKAEFGIERDESCEDCCQGISMMTISDPNDCTAFILGDCETLTPPVPPFGEFDVCEFVTTNFTEPIGDNLFDNCN